MIGLITTFFPYLLILYFMYRFLDEPVFLLGIPFMMFMRYCVFFDKVKVFSMPGSLGGDILLLLWLLVFYFIISFKINVWNKNPEGRVLHKRNFNWIDVTMLALIILTIVGLVIVIDEYYILNDVTKEFFVLISPMLGYFIIKELVRYLDMEKLIEFLYLIVIVNSIASFFYFVHQGLHFQIYDVSEEYFVEFFQGEQITRTFWFMPVLWFFSIVFLLIFKRKKMIEFAPLFFINLLGIIISYTRSFLALALLLIFVYFILDGLKRKNYLLIIRYSVIVGLSGVVLFLAVSHFLPASTGFFIDRFKELEKDKSVQEPNNLVYRFERTEEIIEKIDDQKVWIGFGPVSEIQLPFVEYIKAVTSDMAWTGVVFRWGYIGMIMFLILFLGVARNSLLIYFRTDGTSSDLALLFFLTTVSQISESFTSWTFMSPDRAPLSFWYFAVFSGLLIQMKQVQEDKLTVPDNVELIQESM